MVKLGKPLVHALPDEGPGALWPHSAACLNIDDDHLDWHGSADAYRAAKGKVYAFGDAEHVVTTTEDLGTAVRRLVPGGVDAVVDAAVLGIRELADRAAGEVLSPAPRAS